MAAIGRFQKGDDVFHAKVVDGQLYPMHGELFGSPNSSSANERQGGARCRQCAQQGCRGRGSITRTMPTPFADPRRRCSSKAPSALLPDGGRSRSLTRIIAWITRRGTGHGRRRPLRQERHAHRRAPVHFRSHGGDYHRRIPHGAATRKASGADKSFDTFLPMGPYIETKSSSLMLSFSRTVSCAKARTPIALIFDCFCLLSLISGAHDFTAWRTRLDRLGGGQSGDRLEGRIQGLSPLINTVEVSGWPVFQGVF